MCPETRIPGKPCPGHGFLAPGALERTQEARKPQESCHRGPRRCNVPEASRGSCVGFHLRVPGVP
eukprot:7166753-Pyramimonas_sp.AAC.1